MVRCLYDTGLYRQEHATIQTRIASRDCETGKPASPKQQLFETAGRLFYQQGYRATGVDTIAAESGVGKMTLYRNYPSKDDLIVAYLWESDRHFWEAFEESTRAAATQRGKLLAFFAALQSYATTPACHGCPFLNLASEYPQPDHPGHQVAAEHKRAVQARFGELAEEAGAREPSALTDALVPLMDGVYQSARLFGAPPDSPVRHLAEAVRQLIEA